LQGYLFKRAVPADEIDFSVYFAAARSNRRRHARSLADGA